MASPGGWKGKVEFSLPRVGDCGALWMLAELTIILKISECGCGNFEMVLARGPGGVALIRWKVSSDWS